jgi:hypothetical protein
MKKIDNLCAGDFIAFEWNYGIGKEIIVSNITSVDRNKVLTHFLYGYRSEAEWVNKKDIIAIGNPNGSGKIRGWSGKFDILLPDHELLK